MRRWVKGLLFTGLGIIIAGIIALFIAFAINGFSWKRTLLPGQPKKDAKINTLEETINDEFSNINVDLGAADIKVEKAEDGICRVTYKYRGEDPHLEIGVSNDAFLEIGGSGNTLEIKQEGSDVDFDWENLDQILDHLYNQVNQSFDNELGTLVIYLPEKEYEIVDIYTASGEIESVNPISCKEANLHTASGDIQLENIKGKSMLNLAAASGDLSIKNTEGFETVNIAVASGNIEINDTAISSQMNASAASGDITLNQVRVSGRADLESTSGEIRLINTEFQEGEVETTSGDIYLEYAKAEKLFLKTTSGNIYGRIDADINVRGTTTSGDYSAPSGTKGEWRTETTSGDVKLEY